MGKGQLLFKGDKAKKKKKMSKHSKEKAATDQVPVQESSSSSTPSSAPVASKPKAEVSAATPTIRKGTGKITTSGTVVTGHNTNFEKELANGDAIMVVINGQEELRVVTMRLSNQSLNLSSSFSASLKSPASFQYIRKPRDAAKERMIAQRKEKLTREEQEQHAFDLYSSSSQMVYREKTETGSYRIKKEQVQGGKSRGDLLAMRAKKSSDKYC